MKKTFLKFDNVDSISSSHKSYLSNKNSLNNSIKKGKISSTIKFKKHLYNNQNYLNSLSDSQIEQIIIRIKIFYDYLF